MNQLYFFDTRHRRKVEFKPVEPGIARLYTCGPTVYNDAHIGNLRAYIFEDLLRRTLKFSGFRVVQVMNLTDVDDKTIRGALKNGVKLQEFTRQYIDKFFSDLKKLNIEPAEYYPAATEHIPEMIALIQALIDKGYAYIADNSVYFNVVRFPEYGQLSGMNLERLVRGARIDADEYSEKEDFRDFALWKGWTPEDGDVYWDAPFGRGRPGWHIECSAMSMKYLGEEFDIHTGGVDNIFPHHENEIAQSVAGTGKPFARYWMHCAHLMVDGEKMSKSLGNFWTLNDLIGKGYSPRVVRYVLLTTHYRQQLNFTDESVRSAEQSLQRLDTLVQAAEVAVGDGSIRQILQNEVEDTKHEFVTALADDLNISNALAVLFDLVGNVHRIRLEKPLSRGEGLLIRNLWEEFDKVLGFLGNQGDELPNEIEEMVRQRKLCRMQKQFKEADLIRQKLSSKGYQIEDSLEGTVVIWQEGRKIV